MNKPIIVLKTHGKHETVDFATVYLFSDLTEARAFCAEKSTGRTKYWTHAEIVNEATEIELTQPEE